MAEATRYRRVSSFSTAGDFREHLKSLGVSLACDDEILNGSESPLAQAAAIGDRVAGNRFAIQPMEGWDGTEEGEPTDLVRRRWANFGHSGAKLIWGGEAFAVCPEGRANPNQLMAREQNRAGIAELRQVLLNAHSDCGQSGDDLVVGLQLTHSGRFCRPFRKDRLEPVIAYHHPILDRKFGIEADHPVVTDEYIEALIGKYVRAACIAADAGYHFVDIKHCHGYLGHELLGGFTREGPFGGSFENRTRFCREIIRRIQAEAPGLGIGVRLSAFDWVPFQPDPARSEGKKLGPGIPEPYHEHLPYRFGFGVDQENPAAMDLTETGRFLEMLADLGVTLINLSCGSPYYNPHIQRPALFPPSDGYQPPEDPLVGVARQVAMAATVKARFPQCTFVGSGYSYLQEYLPHVAQACVRAGMVDFVGLGRMVLSYPELPRDVLEKGKLARKKICRTFSDCTTAPRKGMISGCFPLDPFYKEMDEAQTLKRIKAGEVS
jgi:NADPH2 dehydrogenase